MRAGLLPAHDGQPVLAARIRWCPDGHGPSAFDGVNGSSMERTAAAWVEPAYAEGPTCVPKVEIPATSHRQVHQIELAREREAVPAVVAHSVADQVIGRPHVP